MSKSKFSQAIKGRMNSVFEVGDKTVAWVGWLPRGWRVVPVGASFDAVSDRDYTPIAEYRTSQELYENEFKTV